MMAVGVVVAAAAARLPVVLFAVVFPVVCDIQQKRIACTTYLSVGGTQPLSP